MAVYESSQGYNRALVAGANVSLPIFQGGRVHYAVRAADVRSEAGRSDLQAAEGATFTNAVTVYLDVLRDEAISKLNEQNVSVLQSDFKGSDRRFQGGDLTKTDVAQSGARLEQGEAKLKAAEAALATSKQRYRQVTGLNPNALELPPALPSLPEDEITAESIALKLSPTLAAAKAAAQASQYDVSTARAAAYPTLSLTGATNYYSYRDRFSGVGDQTGSASQAGVTLTVPLYQGGIVSAHVRQAEDEVWQSGEQQVSVERQVVADVGAAFADYSAAQQSIRNYEAQVANNQDALKGVRIESEAGLRQVLDVLNAELELLDSRTALISAQHDLYVAGFQLLNTMGLCRLQTSRDRGRHAL